jgi:hypothetical protein
MLKLLYLFAVMLNPVIRNVQPTPRDLGGDFGFIA